MYKPVIEIWGIETKFDLMNVALNSKLNPSLFQTDAITRIFNRFPIPTVFNKLPSRFYYMGQLDIQRVAVCIQGQQTMLWLNDFSKNINRLSDVQDMSKSYDTRLQKLPVLGGTYDKLSGMRRGSATVRFNSFEVEVWPKRNFNRYSDRLLVSFNDFQYTKRVIHSKLDQSN